MKGKKFLAFSLAATLLIGSSISVFAAGVKDVFNANTYAGNYSDLAANYGTDASALLNHFLTNGAKEGRVASPILDVAKYRAAYADLDAAFGDDWDAYVNHYLTTGILEGRTTGVLFNLVDYVNKNADIKAAFGNDYAAIAQHYVTFGINENRPGGAVTKASTSTSSSSAPAAPAAPTAPVAPAAPTQMEHEHKGVEIGRLDPTCTEPGYIEYRCTEMVVFGVFDKDGNLIGTTTGQCDVTWREKLDPAHQKPETIGNMYIEHATCQHDGKYVYTCTKCGKSVTEIIEKYDHNYAYKETVKPTSCGEAGKGYEVWACIWCGVTTEKNPLYMEHTLGGQPNIVSRSTCTERGVAYGYCDRCGEKVTVRLPLADHEITKATVYADTYLTGDAAPSHLSYEIEYCKNCKEITNDPVEVDLTKKQLCTDKGGLCSECGLFMDRNVTSKVKVYKKGEFFWATVQ